jgi:hypothetical protein
MIPLSLAAPTETYRLLVEKTGTFKPAGLFSNSQAFIETNESNHPLTLFALKRIPAVGNLMIGTGCFCSLNIASFRDVNYILICDVSSLTELFWKNVGPIIRESTDRIDCLAKLEKHISNHISDYVPSLQSKEEEKTSAAIYIDKLSAASSWLYSDERFQKIRAIFLREAFAFKKLDLADARACAELAAIHSARGLTTDTIYLSNIHNFIRACDFKDYERSLESLMDSRTIIIDTAGESFKITRLLSTLYSRELDGNLFRCSTYPSRHIKELSSTAATQRIRQRASQPIRDLYPIMQITHLKEGDLFYTYGLMMGYYSEDKIAETETEFKTRLAEIREKTGSFAFIKQVELATLMVLHKDLLERIRR